MLDKDLVAALRHKTNVMLDHWQDYERLFPATKVWDFEPPSVGNIVPVVGDGQASGGAAPHSKQMTP